MNWRLEKKMDKSEIKTRKPVENNAKTEKPPRITITITGKLAPCTIIVVI